MNKTRISELRKQKSWTQERLAENSGVAVRTIQRLESGAEASPETLMLLADVFGVDVSDLFLEVGDPGTAATVEDLDRHRKQVRRQTELRAAVTQRWKILFPAIGVILSAVIIAIIGTHRGLGALILIPIAWWVAGYFLMQFIWDYWVNPRLDERFPLTVDGLA